MPMKSRSKIPELYKSAHRACSHNMDVVRRSQLCGCFYCLDIYPVSEIVKWIEEEDGCFTAECPKCGVDSVIPDASGVPLNVEFLATMNKRWF